MATDYELEGGHGRGPRNSDDRGGGKKPGLSRWDKAAQEVPPLGAPGHLAPTPTPLPSSRASRFDRVNLTRLTPYAMPSTSAPEASRPAEGAKRIDIPDFFNADSDYRKERDEVMGTEETPGASKPKTKRSYQMTWEDYRALTDEQRAAVDFNTLLVEAREKDLNTEYTESDEQRRRYEAQVEEMFGEGKGSEVFAPETLAVLKQIDFKSDGEDLDDFLGLKAAITEKELAKFNLTEQVDAPALPRTETQAALSPYGAGGLATEQRAAVYTSALEESMAKAGELLQNFRASAAANRNDEVLTLGGQLNDVKYAPGYGARPANEEEGNIHKFFQDTFASLANRKGDADFAWSVAQETLRPNEMQAFLRYADERTRSATEYGTALGDGKDWLSPEEMRERLGLDRGGRDGKTR